MKMERLCDNEHSTAKPYNLFVSTLILLLSTLQNKIYKSKKIFKKRKKWRKKL